MEGIVEFNDRDRPYFLKKREQKTFSFGQGLVEYAIILGLVALAILGGLALTGEGTKDAYEDVAGIFSQETPTAVPEDLYKNDRITVKVMDQTGQGIYNVVVYAFNNSGSYTGKNGRTNQAGLVEFLDMTDGSYKFRADLQANQFWSAVILFPSVYFTTIQTGQSSFPVKVVDSGGSGINNVQVYAFTSGGSYVGVGGRTGADGVVTLNLVNGDYKFRADYQSRQLWSDTVNIPGVSSAIIQTGQNSFPVKVVDSGGSGINNVQVYAFTSGGSYIGVGGRTGADGVVTLNLVNGDYKFRADYQSRQLWSDTVNIPDASEVTIIAE